jgi:hypothetical protein
MPYTAKALDPKQRLIDAYESSATGKGKYKQEEFQTKDQLIDAFLKDNSDKLRDIGRGKVKMHDPNDPNVLKLNITKTDVTRSSITDSTIAGRVDYIGEVDRVNPSISSMFDLIPVSSDWNRVVRYLDQTSITRGANAIAEGAVFPESGFTWTETKLELQKIADSIPVVKEVFLDMSAIRRDISRLLDINIQLKEDDLYWDGDGVATKITGMYTKAPTFSAGTYANAFTGVTIWDLLVVMRTSIMKNKIFTPDVAVINPDDALKFKIQKGSDSHYILPQILKEKGLDGMTIIESSQVTANTLAIGDSRYGTNFEFGLQIAMGYVGTGFTDDVLTIAASKWSNLLIREVEKNAFLKCTNITTALAALDSGVADVV